MAIISKYVTISSAIIITLKITLLNSMKTMIQFAKIEFIYIIT